MPDDIRTPITAPPGAPKPPAALDAHRSLLDRLAQIVGPAHVASADADRAFFAEDTYRSLETPLAAVAPGTVEELAAVAAACNGAGVALVPRGGGYSYTDGYLHARTASVTVDTRRLNRIVEINPVDMYVTVEVGCTWKALNDALEKQGLRTPYWGPLSGHSSVVGGALSQNSVFFGSGLYGSAVEQVIGLTVVLADGTIVPTGAHALKNGKPFMKHYGPDLMGPFLADAGAMGLKAVATLRLMRRPTARRHISFAFPTAAAMADAMGDLARAGIACECMGFDAGQQSARVTEAKRSFSEDLRTLLKVIEQGGIMDGARIALAGRGYLKNVPYGMHCAIEDKTDAGVDALAREAKRICKARGGRALPASITRIVHADPFIPPDSILGPKGERWVPVHCIVPLSQATTIISAVQALYARFKEQTTAQNIRTGFLLITVGNYGFLIEPVFFWPDARLAMYDKAIRSEHLARLPTHPANEAARAVVHEMRCALAELFVSQGAVSMQLGKFYLYDRSREPAAWEMLKRVKALVDPQGLMNPGALKL
jgi:FAD/FMN-containing dehydrogenase